MAATVVALVVRRREERASRERDALRMVTASDVVPLHLSAAAKAPAGAHGSYRTRPGARVAVLTTSQLPPLGRSEAYVAWAHRADGWDELGPVVVEGDGRSLLVVETDAASPAPDELRVTRESGSPSDAPRGTTVLAWPAPTAPTP